MKMIVAGCREGIPKAVVHQILDEEVDQSVVEEIVSGGARGVDTFGEQWAYFNNIEVTRYPADWKKYGKKAGFVRNAEMARYADALIAFWDGKSKGTEHMIKVMNDLKKPTMVIHFHNGEEVE
jgi:hypothetical protein